MTTVHAFDFLDAPSQTQPMVCAVVGEDRFLKRLTLTKIRDDACLEDAGAPIDGSKAQWRDVVDELSTRSLFGDGPRLVLVESADDFVNQYRAKLESIVDQPHGSACLILDLKSFPSNTRLYKSIQATGLVVDCKPPQKKRGKSSVPDETRIRQWMVDWSMTTHQIRLTGGADEELLELTGANLGRIDQELAKLALFGDTNGEVSVDLVRQVVGGWRAKTSWDLIDAALDGNAAEAMLQLERLLHSGEVPQMITGALVWSIRRYADAAQRVMEAERHGRRITLPIALEQAGIKKWPRGALQRAERQLRQLGRERASNLFRRLLQLDLSLKGTHAAPHRSRWALEKFILSLSREAA